MVKDLLAFLTVCAVGSIVLIYQYGTVAPNREIQPGLVPYGTATRNDARWEPIVRLVSPFGYCSGWVVDANYVVTAGHCINNDGHLSKELVKIYDINGNYTSVVAKPVGLDERMDLGLLKGEFSNFKVLPTEFEQEGFPMDNPHTFTSCGYPLGQKKLSCTRVVPFKTNMFMMEVYGHLIAGESGGPVIDDVTGKAVGVNDAVGENSAFVQPIQGALGLFGLE